MMYQLVPGLRSVNKPSAKNRTCWNLAIGTPCTDLEVASLRAPDPDHCRRHLRVVGVSALVIEIQRMRGGVRCCEGVLATLTDVRDSNFLIPDLAATNGYTW